jgi:hypothetical protein
LQFKASLGKLGRPYLKNNWSPKGMEVWLEW